MGNATTSTTSQYEEFKGAQIYIEVLQNSFLAGQKLNAKVHLHCFQPFAGAKSLQITVLGQEAANWMTKPLSKSKEFKPENLKSRTTFLQVTKPIHDFPADGMPEGMWTFPVEMVLPDWCPSSVAVCGSDGQSLKIAYKIRAEIIGENN